MRRTMSWATDTSSSRDNDPASPEALTTKRTRPDVATTARPGGRVRSTGDPPADKRRAEAGCRSNCAEPLSAREVRLAV